MRRRHHKTHVPQRSWEMEYDHLRLRLGLPPMPGRRRRRLNLLTQGQRRLWWRLWRCSWQVGHEMGWVLRA
jgi:hypothetical protein